MSETNTTPPLVAPPGWQEAMQGKVGNAKRAAASKRIFLVLTLTFFGMMTWLYIIYSLGHSKKAAGAGEVPIAASAPTAEQGGMPMGTNFPNQFGLPRGMEAPSAAAPVDYQTAAMPQAMPQPMAQQAPSEFGAPAGAGNPYATAAFAPQAVPTVRPSRGGITITGPRDLRHQVGIQGGSMPGLANIPSQRMRMFVAR